METWINRFSRARLKMEKLAYYLLQPLRPEKWKTQGAPYLVLRKNEGLNAEKLTFRLMQPDRGGRPAQEKQYTTQQKNRYDEEVEGDGGG